MSMKSVSTDGVLRAFCERHLPVRIIQVLYKLIFSLMCRVRGVMMKHQMVEL